MRRISGMRHRAGAAVVVMDASTDPGNDGLRCAGSSFIEEV